MASTYTTNKSIEKPANGDYVNTWSTPVNSDWDIIDTSLGGTTTINATGASGTVTLSTSQYRPPTIIITGVLTASVTYRIPSGIGGHWVIYNNTSGAFSITIDSGGGGTSSVVPQGFRVLVYSDGTNIGPGITSVPLAAAGNSGEVQFNSSGSLAGSSNLTYDGSGNLVLGGVTPGRLDVRNAFRIYGSTSGYFGLTVPAAAGSTTYTLPNADGTSGQALTTNGSGTLSWTTVSGGVAGVTSFSAGTTGLTPAGASTGAVVLSGTLATANGGTGSSSSTYCSLTSNVTGTLPIANGGTGLTATPTNGQLDIGNGTGFTRSALTAGSGVSITNGAGSITISATGSGGTVTSVSGTGTVNGITLTGTVTSSGSLTLGGTLSNVSLTTQVTGTLPVGNGGTGITAFGTGVATALGQNVTGSGGIVLATSPTLVTPNLGTPSSGVVTNLTGTASININGTVGATTPNTGSFTTLTTSSTVTLNGGTANGVVYLNGSKQATTGSAVTYDGTTFATTGASNFATSSGSVGIGGSPAASAKVEVLGTLPTSSAQTRSILQSGTIPSGTTGDAVMYASAPSTAAASFTLSELSHFWASGITIGSGSSVTSQYGFLAPSTLTQATNNYGFYSNIASGSNRWNFYAGGTANNYFGGDTYIRTTSNLVSTAVLHIDTAGGTFGSTVEAKNQDDSRPIYLAWNSATSNDNSFMAFGTEAAYTFRGSITYNRAGGVVAYNTTSDYRAKDVYGPVTDSGLVVDSLQVYRGKMHGATTERPMMIAHEMQAVTPYAVTGQKDAADENGNPIYQQVDHSTLVPLLIAEIQSLRARVLALESSNG